MVNTNSVLSSILFSQTIDWNIKQFFSSTSINSSFELKRIGKAMPPRGCGCAGNNPESPPNIHKKSVQISRCTPRAQSG